jgi:hypothetical protein
VTCPPQNRSKLNERISFCLKINSQDPYIKPPRGVCPLLLPNPALLNPRDSLPIESHLPIHLRLFCREIPVAEKGRTKVQASLQGGAQVCNVRSPRYHLETHKLYKSSKASPSYLTSLRFAFRPWFQSSRRKWCNKRVVRQNPGAHRATPNIGAPNVTEGTSSKEKPFKGRSMPEKRRKTGNATNPAQHLRGRSYFCGESGARRKSLHGDAI